MKKIIFLLLFCLILSGCSNSQSIAVIGGADGPTSIMVSSETKGEKTSVKMLRINGELYYDTGSFSENVPRCGTLDGSLLNVAGIGGEFDIPKEDNGTNFGPTHTTYFGYQLGDKYTVEVPIDGGFKIFRKITDAELDVNKYNHCMYLKGFMPGSSSETEMIVLSNDVDIDFGMVAKSMVSSNSKDFLDIYTIFPNEDNLGWGVYLEAKNVRPTGLTLKIAQSGGYPSGQLQTGDWYELERLEGGWMPVETVISNYAWNTMAYLLPENGEYEKWIGWEWLYGELPKGNYRLAKKIMDFRESGDFDERVFYAYFEIE